VQAGQSHDIVIFVVVDIYSFIATFMGLCCQAVIRLSLSRVSHQAVIRLALSSRQVVVRQSSSSHQAVIRQSSGSHQAVFKQLLDSQLSGGHQSVI
jgi:hypothetical protein